MTGKLIDRNPDILGCTPVFSGTRVPLCILMEHLEAGLPIPVVIMIAGRTRLQAATAVVSSCQPRSSV